MRNIEHYIYYVREAAKCAVFPYYTGIRGVIPAWEPFLDRAITAFQDDWARHLRKSAEAICELLKNALRGSATETLVPGTDGRAAAQRVEQWVKNALRDEEDRFRHKICGFFRPTRGGTVPEALVVQHLFSEEAVRVFGLSKHQLALTSATLVVSLKERAPKENFWSETKNQEAGNDLHIGVSARERQS